MAVSTNTKNRRRFSTTMAQQQHRFVVLVTILLGATNTVTGISIPFRNLIRNRAAASSSAEKVVVVDICQNKDCRQRWPLQSKLSDVFYDFLVPPTLDDAEESTMPSFHVQASGCQSECHRGPNLRVLNCNHNHKQQDWHGINGPIHLADEMEAQLGITVPSKLVAAVTVMEKALKISSPSESIRFLTSVIDVLMVDPALQYSSAYARARALRAQVRLDAWKASSETPESTTDTDERHDEWELIMEDARVAVDLQQQFPQWIPPSVAAVAWRVQADAYRRSDQSESCSQHILRALQGWARADPSMHTKIQAEIQCVLAEEQRLEDQAAPSPENQQHP